MRGKRNHSAWDWHVPVIGALGLLLYTSNRRRKKTDFETSGEGDIESMLPTFVGLTEGSIDRGNRVEVIQNGAFFDRLIQDVSAAEGSIHIESFIWWTGEVCERLGGALAAAARRGVEVRLMVDYSGSRTMDRHLLAEMKEAGCDVRKFRPPRISNVGRMNLRTHRKIAVIDGRIGYVGGHGIAEEWSGNAEDRDHWRDIAVRAEGPVVTTLQGVFCENWIQETGEVPTGETYFPELEPVGPTDAHVAFASPRGSISAVQLLYYLAINASRRELIIQNPFFLPHADAIEALKKAVRRGVDVRIMLPAVEAVGTQQAFVEHASHHHFGDLLGNGVRIFEYQRSLLHQKVMIVDGSWSCVGSTNFDDRSFELNDELTVGFVGTDMASRLKHSYDNDCKDCEEVSFDQWRRRPWKHRLLDGAAFTARREL
jgi:cardiolipin synthase